MVLNIKNETALLISVVLGQPLLESNVSMANVYDAKSYISLKQNTYPLTESIQKEMLEFEKILRKYNVKIYKPNFLDKCNLIFSRDVSFVIDDYLVISKMTKYREREQEAYTDIYKRIAYNKIVNLPAKARIEGGDVILYNDIVFIGVYQGKDFDQIKTARTNIYALEYLKEMFPHKEFIPIELNKDDYNPISGTLHLDCSFMPFSEGRAILYKGALKNKKDYYTILDIFGKDNIFQIDQNESCNLHSNLFSISPNIVVSDTKFTRLNTFLEQDLNMTVEKISYSEVSKTGGLFRCSTLPLERIVL